MTVPEQMLYGIKPQQSNLRYLPYVYYSGAQRFLSGPECREIVSFMGEKDLRQGLIGTGEGQSRLDVEYRSVYTQSMPVEGFEWLYERLLQRVVWVNNDNYRFDITGLVEPVQFLEYREAPNAEGKSGRYRWHTDTGPGIGSTRKLSCVIQLSDPRDYEGCRLRLFDCTGPELEIPEIGQGDMVVFPSYTPHMVSDLISGTRRSLAIWVSGPSFR